MRSEMPLVRLIERHSNKELSVSGVACVYADGYSLGSLL